MAAPTIRNTTSTTGSPGAGGTITVTTPTNQNGDLLVLQIVGTPTSASTPTASGYSVYSPSSSAGSSGYAFVLTHISNGSEPSTFNVSFPTAGTYDVFCHSLIGAGAPNAGASVTTIAGATNNSTVAITTTTTDSLILAAFRCTNGTLSVTSPLTSITTVGKSITAQETQAVVGSYNLKGNSTVNGNWTDTATAFPGSALSVWAPNVSVAAGVWGEQPSVENVPQTLLNRGPVYGVMPGVGVTVPTLRPIQLSSTEDIFTNQVPATSVLMIGGKPNRSVTPPTLRSTMHVPAEDNLSYQIPPPVGSIIGGKPNKPITPSSLRPIVVGQTEDTVSNQVPPSGTVLLGKLFTRAFKIVPVIQASTEDTVSYQEPPARATVLGGKPRSGAIPKTLRQVITAQTEDTLSNQVPATGKVTLVTPTVAPPRTGPRNLITGSQEDVVSYREPPAQAYLFGGEAIVSITPPILRSINFVPAEDILSRESTPSQFFGGEASTPVTPPTLRQIVKEPIIVSAEELTLARQPEAYLFGGKPSRPVTPPIPRVPITAGPEDTISHQRHPEGQILGGKPNARVQVKQVRPVLVAGTEDVLSYQRQAEGTIRVGPTPNKLGKSRSKMIGFGPDDAPSFARPGEVEVLSDKQVFQPYGGKPLAPVTPRSLRSPIIVLAEDALSPQRPAEALRMGGRPVTPVTPPTLRQPIIIPINVLVEDSITVQRPAEFIRWGGTPKPPVAGPRRVTQIFADDVLSFGSQPTAYLYGGKPNKKVTPPYPIYRALIITPVEDVLSHQLSYLTHGSTTQASAFSLIMGGRPSARVTPPGGPRIITLGNTPDTISGEPIRVIVLSGPGMTIIGSPPFTPVTDIYAPTTTVTGSG